MTRPLQVLVCGASIAGPALAFWLQRAGYEVTVVERFAELRRGGQNVDVRGAGRAVLREMGLESAVLAAGTGERGLRFVDDAGAVLAEFPAGSGDSDGPTAEAEILRGELSRLLVEAGDADVEYIFGDYVAGLTQHGDHVTVEFANSDPRRFDFVAVAEGTRSRTRDLAFDDHIRYRSLDMYTAYGTIPRTPGDDDWWRWFNAPGGRAITLRPDNVGTTRVTLSFMSPSRGYEDMDPRDQREVLRRLFAGAGWEAARVLAALDADGELYVDHMTQVLAPRWSNDRVVLVGDAAWCATPISGMGTTLAVTGAYVLAGELARHGDHRQAFLGYENKMRPLVSGAQKLPPGTPRLAHPKSRVGVALLRTALRLSRTAPVRFVADRINFDSADDEFELPPYAFHLAMIPAGGFGAIAPTDVVGSPSRALLPTRRSDAKSVRA